MSWLKLLYCGRGTYCYIIPQAYGFLLLAEYASTLVCTTGSHDSLHFIELYLNDNGGVDCTVGIMNKEL